LSLPHWIKWNKVKGMYEINNNMDCFEQVVKNTSYKIEKYESIDNSWIFQYDMKDYDEALEFFNNNALYPTLTDEQKHNSNFRVFRIVEVKTTSKPVLINNELLIAAKNNIKRLRKQGRI
jgi:hypothetical protein